MEPIFKLSYKKDCKDSWRTQVCTTSIVTLYAIYFVVKEIIAGEFMAHAFNIIYCVSIVLLIVLLILRGTSSLEVYEDKVVYTNMFRKKLVLNGKKEEFEFSFTSSYLVIKNVIDGKILKTYAFAFNKKMADKMYDAGLNVVYSR